MLTPDFTLSVQEFDILCDDFDLGPVPYPLQTLSTGRTVEQRARIRDEVYRRLAEHDFAAGARINAGLEDALLVLLQHELAVDVVGYVGEPLRAVAATDHRTGVLATLVGEEVLLTRIRPAELARSIVELLPSNEPGPGRAMSVRSGALAAAVDPGEENDDPFAGGDERRALARAGVSAADATTLVELANDRVAGGQFGISHHRRRGSALLTWFDTSKGRYLMVSEDSWLSFVPADNERIGRHLATVLARTVEANG